MWQPLIRGSLTQPPDYRNAELLGSRCGQCDAVFFPFQPICFRCLTGEKIERIVLGKKGTLIDYVISTVAPPGFSVPHAQGVLELAGGVKILSLLEGADFELGMEMVLFLEIRGEAPGGTALVGFRFRPAEVRV